jgi:hypothetical protein
MIPISLLQIRILGPIILRKELRRSKWNKSFKTSGTFLTTNI